jgi:transcriptional regulator with GAF, ATPase, and Fis domain
MQARAIDFTTDESSRSAHRVNTVDRRRLYFGTLGEPLKLVTSEREEHPGNSTLIGQSRAMQRVLALARQVAPTDSTVLLLGETGTGKEVIATYVHELSARRGRPMARVNCAAIPSTLIESELFGREKGAFTGAVTRQVGRFEVADRSTILLDEIGDLPIDIQIRLLRVIEERKIERLGSPASIPVDVRIIAATHRDLEKGIQQNTFREDLYYRLNVFPIRVPPLRERVEDIPSLVCHFVRQSARVLRKTVAYISEDSLTALQRYPWPGNIRELRNVVERAMIVANGPELVLRPPRLPASAIASSVKLDDVMKEHIRFTLERSHWRIRGPGGAAERLGLKPTTLETRMAKLGLVRPF